MRCKKQSNRTCKCGLPTRSDSCGYCRDCHNTYQRANRKKHSELSPEQRKKANARSYLNTCLRRGYITKNPCIICGSCEVHGHHEDYNKPLQVIWLCNSHRQQYYDELIEGNNSGIVPIVKEKYSQLYKS